MERNKSNATIQSIQTTLKKALFTGLTDLLGGLIIETDIPEEDILQALSSAPGDTLAEKIFAAEITFKLPNLSEEELALRFKEASEFEKAFLGLEEEAFEGEQEEGDEDEIEEVFKPLDGPEVIVTK